MVTFPDGPVSRETGHWVMRAWDLAVREERRRAYGYLLRAGLLAWIYRWIDGAPFVDLWSERDLPDLLRDAWQPLIDAAPNGPTEEPLEVSFDDIKKSKREELR